MRNALTRGAPSRHARPAPLHSCLHAARSTAVRCASSAVPGVPPPPPADGKPRVRYAPSPTGFLHLGGLRTALYNFLLARALGGKFLLRIEDTDRSRQVPGSMEGLITALQWCGLHYDEGPVLEAPGGAVSHTAWQGPCGPYIQSDRLPIYRAAAEALLASGHAYRCFCSTERLAALRDAQAKAGQPTLYDRACSKIPAGEAERRAAAGEPHTVRLRVPAGSTLVQDAVLGEVRTAHAGVDDQVLLKSDGFPTYHLAAVVDDHAMGITHVIRGQEWLPSTPKHLLTYAALGWTPPTFAHLPLLLNTDRSKLSKRHGDAAVEDFRAAGYTPEGLLNFAVLLGWSPKDGKEVLTLDDMVERFSLESINKSNAVVDRSRLDFFNGQHIRRLVNGVAVPAAPPAVAAGAPTPAAPTPLELPDTPGRAQVREAVTPLLAAALGTEAVAAVPAPRLNAALALQAERVSVYADYCILLAPYVLSEQSAFGGWLKTQVAKAPEVALRVAGAAGAAASGGKGGSKGGKKGEAQPDADVAAAPPPPPTPEAAAAALAAALAPLRPCFADISSAWSRLTPEAFSDAAGGGAALAAVKEAAKAHKLSPGKLMLPLRYCLTGADVGPGLGDALRLLGRDAAVARVAAVADGSACEASWWLT